MRLDYSLLPRLLAIGLLVLACALPARAADGDPPYEASLLRLSEILGALHYLRPLCGADEPTLWRDQMDALVAAEAPSPERRARLVTEFNRSYSSFAALYRNCTPAATTAIERYVSEGSRLTREIATRYGR
jgi:uncharacterized protein (TIGR02301 family)